MAAMIEKYMEDCKKDLDLKSFGDKYRTKFERMLENAGAEGLSVDQLKEKISFICEMNKCISDQLIRSEDDIVNLMANEVECLKLVTQYFSISNEMLDFCSNLDKFVVSARRGHSYISHVIGQLQIDYEIHEDDNGRKRNPAWNPSSYRGIVDVLKKLKTSDMLSGNESAESLLKSIVSLLKKFSDISEASQRYHEKLGEKLKGIGKWRLITNMIFFGSMLCAGALGLLAIACVGLMIVEAPIASLAFIAVQVTIFTLGVGQKCASSSFNQDEIKIKNQQASGNSMQRGATTAIKELGDIKSLIDKLVIHIDEIMTVGTCVMEGKEENSIGFAMKEIKDNLEICREKIEELDKEQKKCIREIREARDKVLEVVKSISNSYCKIEKIEILQ